MTRKSKRRSSIVEIGNGLTKVRIYTILRTDGYDRFTLAWKEGGIWRTRSLASMAEARMITQPPMRSFQPPDLAAELDDVSQRPERVEDGGDLGAALL